MDMAATAAAGCGGGTGRGGNAVAADLQEGSSSAQSRLTASSRRCPAEDDKLRERCQLLARGQSPHALVEQSTALSAPCPWLSATSPAASETVLGFHPGLESESSLRNMEAEEALPLREQEHQGVVEKISGASLVDNSFDYELSVTDYDDESVLDMATMLFSDYINGGAGATMPLNGYLQSLDLPTSLGTIVRSQSSCAFVGNQSVAAVASASAYQASSSFSAGTTAMDTAGTAAAGCGGGADEGGNAGDPQECSSSEQSRCSGRSYYWRAAEDANLRELVALYGPSIPTASETVPHFHPGLESEGFLSIMEVEEALPWSDQEHHGGDGDYYLNGDAAATVPLDSHPHPLALPTSLGTIISSHPPANGVLMDESKKHNDGSADGKEPSIHRKSSSRSDQTKSQYHDITRLPSGRYRAFILESENRHVKQVCLGTYDTEEKAARARDMAALKYRGTSTMTNFPVEDYSEEIEEMKNMTLQEYVAHLKRKHSIFSRRFSTYRGVTRSGPNGRCQAFIYDNHLANQVYLGIYDTEEKAARAHDMAALKYWGTSTKTNFPVEDYSEEIEEMKNMTRQEYVAHLGRKHNLICRRVSSYRGVTRMTSNCRRNGEMRWLARITVHKKLVYEKKFRTEEEAAEAYDVAAIKYRGLKAFTNFDITQYDVNKIMESNILLPAQQVRRKDGDVTVSKRLKV